jgi:hypothetical protein
MFHTSQVQAGSAVGTPVTRRPPHGPGRAVFPHPVPRVDSRPRKAPSQANTRRRLTSVIRGRSMGLAAKIWVKRAQLNLRRFPPRRLSHLHAPCTAQAKKRERAPEWP